MNKIFGILLFVIAIAMLVLGEVISYNNSKLEVSFNNIDNPYVIKVEKDGYVKKPSDPVRAGYNFVGWYKNDKLYDFNTKVSENITIEAKWEKTGDSVEKSSQVIGNSLFEIIREILNFN